MSQENAFLGSISGEATESGHITDLKAVGSFDTEAERNSESSTRQRLYSEDDEEIRMAKAMAMAIHNNPHLKPEDVQKMVADQFHREAQTKEIAMKKKKQEDAKLHPIATALNNFKEEHFKEEVLLEGDKKPPAAANPFHNLTESMLKTREMAKEKLQEVVGKLDAKPTELKVEKSVTILTPESFDKPTTKIASQPSSPGAKPNAAMTLPNLTQMATSLTQSVDKETTERLNASPLLLEAHVWKRRSGMGKYNRNAWERRKMVVRGTLVAYFKAETTLGVEDGQELEPSSSSEELPPQYQQQLQQQQQQAKGKSWLEQAALNLAKANMNSLGLGVTEDPKLPRGCLDLVKERATVSASLGHSGSPTPFCLSVKVRGETRWKLCFDSQFVQMQWLTLLSELVVKTSVKAYNAQLTVQNNDSSSTGFHFGKSNEVFSPPPDQDDMSGLWKVSNYVLREAEEESQKAEEIEVIQEEHVVNTDRSLVIEASEPAEAEEVVEEVELTEKDAEPVWTLKQTDVMLAAAIINSALLFSNASSTPNRFWHVATFANLGLWFLLTKQEPEKKFKGKKVFSKASNEVAAFSNKTQPTRGINMVESEVSMESTKNVAKKGFMPRAGSTAIRVQSPKDSTMKDGHKFAGWRPRLGQTLKVRSHGYNKTKKKVPSPGTIYDLLCMDVVESPKRYPDFAKRVNLPKVTFNDPPGKKTWRSPDIFVISLSYPIEAPASVFAPATDDGEGYTIAMYFKMADDTREILRRVTAEGYHPSQEKIDDVQKSKVNAVRLFEEWCKRAPKDDDFMARMKFVPAIQNVKEAGLPSWMASYNGKPVLIKRPRKTGFLYNHPELSAMEFDVTLHPFPYVAKQGFSYLYQNIFKNLVILFGFVIESRDDDELPECLIGLAELCYPDPEFSISGAEVFAGTSPKSHDDIEIDDKENIVDKASKDEVDEDNQKQPEND